MKTFRVAAGTNGVTRDLSKFCSFASWRSYGETVFAENELKGYIHPDDPHSGSPMCVFVRGMREYVVPVQSVLKI
jgi:hypothetical protein